MQLFLKLIMFQVTKYRKRKPTRLLINFELLLLATFLISAIVQSSEAALDTCDKLNIGGSQDWPPVAYVSSVTNQPEGLGYQLTRRLGKHLDIPVDIQPNFPWARTMNMAAEGEFDIIAGLVFTTARAKFLYFTMPFYSDNLYAYFHRDNHIELTRKEDLLNYERVTIRGASIGAKLDSQLPKTTIVNNEHQKISLIIAKRADYFIASSAEFSEFQRLYSGLEYIKRNPLVIAKLKVSLGVSKASPCAKYLEEFNRFITKFYPLEQ
jgi:ABC-type amino acid transport substrate-binding protein